MTFEKKECAILGTITPIVLEELDERFLAMKFGMYPNSLATCLIFSVVSEEISGCPRKAFETVTLETLTLFAISSSVI